MCGKTSEVVIQGFEVSQTFPHLTKEGKVIGYDTPRIHIFYYKNLAMYKLPYTTSDNGKKIEEKFYYLIWESGKNTGLLYYLGDSLVRSFKVDSAIKDQWPYMIGEYLPEILKNYGTFISREKRQEGNEIEILYSLKGMRGNIPMPGSVAFFYSKELKDIHFSFSPVLDTIP